MTEIFLLCPICGMRLKNGIIGMKCPIHGYNMYNRTDSDNQNSEPIGTSWKDFTKDTNRAKGGK